MLIAKGLFAPFYTNYNSGLSRIFQERWIATGEVELAKVMND